MEVSGTGKSPNTSLSFRYIANNEELEELCDAREDDSPTPVDTSPCVQSENASPKKGDKTPSILDKYFKSIRALDKEREEKDKSVENKVGDESRNIPKEVSSSPVKDYLKNFGKKSVLETSEVKEVGSNETWKLFHDFKYKIAQAVEDMKTRSLEETKEKEKVVPRDSSISDSEENSIIKDSDQSVGDTDNQVSSLNSSIQNLSEVTQPLTAKVLDELSLPYDTNCSEASDDTQKNQVNSEMAHLKPKDETKDSNPEVESGVEALEDTIDAFNDDPLPPLGHTTNPNALENTQSPSIPPANFNHPPSQVNINKTLEDKKKTTFLSFSLYFFTFLLFVNYILFPEYYRLNGFLLGLWVFYIGSNIKDWVLENYFCDWEPNKRSFFQLNRSSNAPITYTIPSVKEYRPIKKYEGWVNHYRFPEYDPYTYSVCQTKTAFMKLEGCNLRLSYTMTKIPKRALWDEKIEKVEFYQHRIYNLIGAKIILLPKGLVARRQWSKKYPICIKLNENEKIQVLEKDNVSEKKIYEGTDKKKEQTSPHEVESTETNTSPERKKKFVWRRKDKSAATTPVPHTETEVSKDGLRHRVVRKKQKERKSETSTLGMESEVTSEKKLETDEQTFHDAEDLTCKSTTSTKTDIEEDIDDTELSKITKLLEETEMDTAAVEGASEGEWTVQVKQSRDKYACLFIFGRTGRDKHEWFRRLTAAVIDATPPMCSESPGAEEKPSEPDKEKGEGVDVAVYKVTEKDTIAFSKKDLVPTESKFESNLEKRPLSAYSEQTFWPFLLKIIETHEMIAKSKSEMGVMCQLEPSPLKRNKSKKKSKESKQKSSMGGSCNCRLLPSEVTWLNTVLARMFYDLMRNDILLKRMQTRIQKKLATLKLPSFMSPLVVTELSLMGACPLVERVCPPAWDERGVWLDADLRYEGGAYISVLTQINLMKLKEKNVTLEDHLFASTSTAHANLVQDLNIETESSLLRPKFAETPTKRHHRKPAVYDSEVEDSAESSDDDSPPLQPVDSTDSVPATLDTSVNSVESGTAPGSSKKKFLRMVDKIATNKYFQQVTDYKYIKRAMEGLSNTDIKLQLEVQGLEGRLALNLPPPPHDRVWFGFRTNPQLVLKARPAVGQRTLRFAQISNWIEQKLSKEFEKVLVLPNMEDIVVDVMSRTPVDEEDLTY